MVTVAATPFIGLLGLFAAVPLGVMAILGAAECAGACRRRLGRPRDRR